MTTSTSTIIWIGLLATLVACAPDGQGGANNVVSDMRTISGGTAGQSPQQRALAQQQRQYAVVRVQSAAGGAITGALGCYLAGCSQEQTIAAIAAGGAVGYLAGGYLTNKNQSFQADQQTLQRDIALAREDNQKLGQSVAAARSVVSFQQSEIARLNQAYSAGTLSAGGYKAQLAKMRSDVSATQSLISTSNERLTGLNNSISQHSRAGYSTYELQQQRDAQIRQIQELRGAENAMINNINHAPASVRS